VSRDNRESDCDELNWKSFRASVDQDQKSSDVELENSIAVQLVARFRGTRLEFFIAFELDRCRRFFGW
jgi:hypothetical protein